MSKTITLKNSNTNIPVIGYGTGTKWYASENPNTIDKELVKSIHEALSLGYIHLDAAEMYGTDASIGEALRTQSISRDKLWITSKVYKNMENIEQACLDILSRLGIDYLDLYLIHSPYFDQNKISIVDAWKQMEKLVDNGKVKAIGVSNFQIKHLQDLLASNPKIKPAINQIEFNPYLYKASKDLVDLCHSNGIAIEAYSPLGPISYKPGGPVDQVIEELAKKYKRSPAQILLKWNLIKGDVIVTTSGKRERLEDFLQTLDESFQLTNEDIQAIDEAGAQLHFRKYWAEQIDGKKSE